MKAACPLRLSRLRRSLRVALRRALVLLTVIAAALGEAGAADWLKVASDRLRTVELDRASVLSAEAGTKVAWGRIVLGDRQAEVAGYRIVSALNRYDCRRNSFVTVKRVYLSADNRVLREEAVADQTPVPVRPGTVDEKFYAEVCKPEGVEDLQKLAKAASERAGKAPAQVPARSRPRKADGVDAPAQESPRAMRRADIQLAEAQPEAVGKAPAAPKEEIAPKLPVPREAAPKEAAPKDVAPPQAAVPKEAAKVEPEPAPAPRAAPSYLRPAALRSAGARRSSATSAPPEPASPAMAHGHAWSYGGETGPAHWSELSPAYAQCARGERQSPIDIRDGIAIDLEPLRFDYKPSYFRIVDNGHTIQATLGAGLTLTVRGRQYELQQVHFHRPAEERINGRVYAMSAHLVLKDIDGRLAVVTVLLDSGGASQPALQTLWSWLPLEKNEEFSPPVPVDLGALLPAERGYYTYMGSLTTPPCTEGVLWLVLKQPVPISAEQEAVFARYYRVNARPLQQANGRIVQESR